MEEKKKGFVPVMLTPFQPDGKIDYEGLTLLTEFYLRAGASGLFANCQSSEMYELSEEESLTITKHVLKVVGGRVPVVAASALAGSMEKQALHIKRMYETGVEAVILITSLLVRQDEPDTLLDERFFRLLELTDQVPLGFYECPEPYKRVLSPDQLQRFVATGRVIYHKDTCLELEQVKAKIALTRGAQFGLYDAYMAHAVASLEAGSAGLSCIQGNFFPELIVWLCENFDHADKLLQVNKVQQFLIEQMEVMHQVYPVVAKYFLQKRGLKITTFSRRDVGDFDKNTKLAIDKLYHAYTDLAEELGLPVAIVSASKV